MRTENSTKFHQKYISILNLTAPNPHMILSMIKPSAPQLVDATGGTRIDETAIKDTPNPNIHSPPNFSERGPPGNNPATYP